MMDKEEIKESNEISSETNIAKNKSKIRGKKRKRLDSDTSTDGDDVLPENTLEFESNVHASAIKNNLDDESVRKILKKVVTNDHVLALVKLQEEEEDSGTEESLRPKITRSKAKELMKVSRSKAPWNLELTPINHIPVKTRPEVKALIAQELPEDEDDEEYEPTPDDSDDDHISFSDLESQPRTPATPQSQNKTSPKIVQDGPFKVPQDLSKDVCKKLDLNQEEEATIALRTRSKLSLSSTSIEHIESSFIPPDYLPVPDVDDLWNEFLTECLNPAPNARHEDDDETDPEYSVAADPDANEEDEEALENSIIKISKKELNDLVTELFHVMPQEMDVQLDNIQDVLGEGNGDEVNTTWEGKQEPLSDEDSKVKNFAAKIPFERRDSKTRFSIGKTEPDDIDEHDQALVIDASIRVKEVPEIVVEENQPGTSASEAVPVRDVSARASELPTSAPLPLASPAPPADLPDPEGPAPPAPLRALLQAPAVTLTIQVDDSCKMYPQQVQLLQQQLRQHIQLATSNFLQLYVHPMHWSYAPQYKEYLLSFNKMTIINPKSVADVCNLKPAIELVESWERSLSDNTPDSVAIVEFIQKEVEKCRRRTTQNSVYFADFPELFKKVVANSTVFLYPYLLPPVPYKADFKHKRFNYLRSEDELIVLGLDQFWQYVEKNPQLFKRPPRLHPRRRWGLTTAARLVCRHTLPALTLRALLSHLKTAQRSAARDSPIVNYFKNHTIEPVKHKLLPYNPNITLYEQPEFEMPRLWIRYLAKSSKRFKDHLHRRTTQPPAGVEIEMGINVESPQRNPLPIDFTKQISCDRINLLPPKSKPVLMDKMDVHIQKSNENVTNNTTFLVASNLYTIVNTSTGTQLVPLQVTNTVDSSSTPICSPAVVNNDQTGSNIDTDCRNAEKNDKSINNNEITNSNLEPNAVKKSKETKANGHCKCCILFKKIRRKRQSFITDYFNSNNKRQDNVCGCRQKKYPKITNKLRLLVNNYKTLSKTVYNEVVTKIEKCKTAEACNSLEDSNTKDLVSAILFQIKLVERTNIARNNTMKRTLHTAFAKFDVENGDPVKLSERLFEIFDVELADMYKEFLGFLTAEQADKLDQFKDYFVRNCVQELIVKIEEIVLDNKKRQLILENLKEIILDNMSHPCELCCKLLNSARDHPALAQYIYSLFPHRWKEKTDTRRDTEVNGRGRHTICEELSATADYEADNSSSNEVIPSREATNSKPQPLSIQKPDIIVTTIKCENPEASEMSVDETEQRNDESSDSMSMLIMSEDESVKTEIPEWKRDEDKFILEVLKQCVRPNEIKDKTIIEIIEDKNVVNMISESLSHKSYDDVRGRILYLLQLLVNTDK